MSSSKQKESSKNPFKHYAICSWIDPEDTRKFPDELCDLKGLLKLLQKKKTKGPVIATYYLILKCKSKGETQHVDLSCTTVPETVRALKEEIEEQHSIPAEMQLIMFHSELLADNDKKLKKLGVRNKDILEVSYNCEAEVQKVQRILKWVDYTTAYLHNQHPLVSTELSIEAEMLATIGLNERLCERMAVNYFSPPENPRVKANKIYFLSKNGVSRLANLLYIVTDQPWGEQVLHLKLLESKLLDALRCFANGSENYQKELIQHDVVGYAVMMLSQIKLVPHQPAEDLMGSPGVKAHNNFLVLDMVSSVLEMMWTMRKHKELYTDMTTLDICVDRLVAISLCPSFTNRQASLALYLLTIRLCWLESVDDLGKASVLLLDVPQARQSYGEKSDEVMMAKYFCALFVAWKLLYNCKYFKASGVRPQIEKTLTLMKDFLATANRETLIRMIEKYDLAIYNLLPMFGLLFHPKSQPRTLLPTFSLDFVSDLEISAMKCILLHLQVVLSQPEVRVGLGHKDIGEYLVCLPWGLPPSLKPYAQELVSYVHKFKPLPIPKLSIMVRSCVARSYLEFDKLQKEKAGEGILDRVAHPQIARVGLPLMSRDQLLYVISIQ